MVPTILVRVPDLLSGEPRQQAPPARVAVVVVCQLPPRQPWVQLLLLDLSSISVTDLNLGAEALPSVHGAALEVAVVAVYRLWQRQLWAQPPPPGSSSTFATDPSLGAEAHHSVPAAAPAAVPAASRESGVAQKLLVQPLPPRQPIQSTRSARTRRPMTNTAVAMMSTTDDDRQTPGVGVAAGPEPEPFVQTAGLIQS